MAYNDNTDLNLELKVNDSAAATQSVRAFDNNASSFTFEVERESFNSLEVSILNEDNLDLDNHYIVYDLVSEHNYKALIVSENPFYIAATLEAYGKIDTIDVKIMKSMSLILLQVMGFTFLILIVPLMFCQLMVQFGCLTQQRVFLDLGLLF